MAHGILLEAGTNEMELLVFRVADTYYGVNVAKVRELIQRVDTIRVPHSPYAVEGSFRLRDEVLSLVSLPKYLKKDREPAAGAPSGAENEGLIIIIEFNAFRCGILVDGVEMIHRLRWDAIEPPSELLTRLGTPVTATARVGDNVVLILDFETIVADLFGHGKADAVDAESIGGDESLASKRVLLADDSPTVRDAMQLILKRLGFGEVVTCNDGQAAWETIEKSKNEGRLFDLVVSDVEMPRIDGLHLTALIKKDPVLAKIHVVLFSSVVRAETTNKGKAVGADAQVAKNDREGLLKAIRECVSAQ